MIWAPSSFERVWSSESSMIRVNTRVYDRCRCGSSSSIFLLLLVAEKRIFEHLWQEYLLDEVVLRTHSVKSNSWMDEMKAVFETSYDQSVRLLHNEIVGLAVQNTKRLQAPRDHGHETGELL